MTSEEILTGPEDAVQEPEIKFERSEQIGELFGALAKAQLKFKPIVKETENPYYHSKYADLSQCISATQPALAKNGLVVVQFPNTDARMKTMGLTSVLGHSSGQWMRGTLTLPAEMSGRDGKMRFDSQSVGAAMTYARRYAYQALVCVAAETDDDANATLGNGSKGAAQDVAKRKLAEKGVSVGTILAGPHLNNPDLWMIVPTWTITDKTAKAAAAKAMTETVESFAGVFLPNSKSFVAPKEHSFDLTDALVKQGWKLVTADAPAPASSSDGYVKIDDIRYPKSHKPFAYILWCGVDIPIWKDGDTFAELKEAYDKEIKVRIVYTTKPNEKEPKRPYHDLVSFTWEPVQQEAR